MNHTQGKLEVIEDYCVKGEPLQRLNVALVVAPATALTTQAIALTGRVHDPLAEQSRADARRIALCWNSHDALVEALELLITLNMDQDETTLAAIAQARAALNDAGVQA